MKKLFVAFATILSSMAVFAQPEKTVVNDPNAQVRKVGSFTGISASGGISIYLSQGNTDAVAISCSDPSMLDKIVTEVSNGVLKIHPEKNSWNNYKRDFSIKAYITIQQLNFLDLSGACALKLTEPFSVKDLRVDISGASILKGDIKGNNLNIDAAGASNIKGEWKFNTIELDLSGASSIGVTGKANKVECKISGASSFKTTDFVVANCKVNASGASSFQITVTDNLDAVASGASSIKYKGSPAINRSNASGASGIKEID